MLHLVTASPDQALAACAQGDDLVLMHAAVLAAGRAACPPSVRVHAMAADLAARGIAPGTLAPGVAPLDDAGLVALAVRHESSLTWS